MTDLSYSTRGAAARLCRSLFQDRLRELLDRDMDEVLGPARIP